jgi:hypothetical protein
MLSLVSIRLIDNRNFLSLQDMVVPPNCSIASHAFTPSFRKEPRRLEESVFCSVIAYPLANSGFLWSPSSRRNDGVRLRSLRNHRCEEFSALP